jgi:sarcosine oxidase, subunit gamma
VTARSALVGRSADLARLSASEVRFLAQVDVRASEPDASALGLPIEPNTVAARNGQEALWLGPDEWLIVSDPGTADALVDELEAALAAVHHSVVDVSANRTVLELAGTNRHDLLSVGCPIDLHPRSWGEGRCAQTVFGGAPVLLQERSGSTRVFVRPSFVSYVIDLLLWADGA